MSQKSHENTAENTTETTWNNYIPSGNVCMHAWMHACMDACMHACMDGWMDVCSHWLEGKHRMELLCGKLLHSCCTWPSRKFVSFPINSMADLSIAMINYQRAKPTYSHGFPWFSYGLPENGSGSFWTNFQISSDVSRVSMVHVLGAEICGHVVTNLT